MLPHTYAGYGVPPGPSGAQCLPASFLSSGAPWGSDANTQQHTSHGNEAQAHGTVGPTVPRGDLMLSSHGEGPAQHTQYPYVTGSAVIALKYRDGVIMATDTLGSYGRTLRYKSVQRMHQVAPCTLLGAGGEMSDFFFINSLFEELLTGDYQEDDGHVTDTPQVFSYLTRVMYNRRNKFDPLWNSLVVAGCDKGKPFLGQVSMIGVAYTDDHVATGYGSYLVRPLLRTHHRNDMSLEEAVQLLEKGLRVLFARDSSFLNKIQLARVTADGVTISDPFSLNIKWDYSAFVNAVPDKFSGSW